MPYLLLTLLGGFEATLDAEPVTGFVTNKERALLAFLAIEAFRPHRRAELAAMFWPDGSEKKAAHSLSHGLLNLRKALGGREGSVTEFLLVTSQDVQFNSFSDYHIDVARFRELVNLSDRHNHADLAKCDICHKWLHEAASLYRGDLLSGLFLPNCEKFEEWRLVQQEELHHQALETLEQLSIYCEQHGEWDLVQEYSRRQIALEPWRETAHQRLMRAMVQSGQVSAAIKQYYVYSQILFDELGLEPSGDIQKFYEQIRSGKTLPSRQTTTGDSIWLPGHGERRQVTTLVCSRRSSSDLEEGPEQELVCERYCEPIFKRFGGRRAPRQGASCLVYFGYPQAFEDSARRAVHSGLAMAAAQEGTGAARIGIHTGLMLVGEGRSPRWQDRDLSGLSLDVARDCHRLAHPGEVLITEDVLQLVQDAFKVEELPIVLPVEYGKTLSAYRVRDGLGHQSRLDWLVETQRLTPYTGRETEFSQLEACYEEIQQGRGKVVIIRGDPGIGKSRLLWQLKKKVERVHVSEHDFGDHRPVLWLETHCLPHFQNTNLYPIVVMLEQLVGIQADDDLDARREKLKGTLAWYGMSRPATLWLLSNLLGLQTEASTSQTITPPQREQMRLACLELLQKRALEHPFVLVIEDLHWSDPSTIEWIDQSFETLASPPCLVLLTARPEFTRKWQAEGQEQPDLRKINLDPLSEPDVKDLVNGLLGDTQLEESLYQHILAHTDGVPLYIEELTKALLEHPVRQSDTLRIGSKVIPGIPATLQDSLMARLDALGTAKETAQWAAVLGREFDLTVLQVCVPYEEARLQDDLARLIQAELITPVEASLQEAISVPPARQPRRKRSSKTPIRYSFKHALLQDAIYTSLLKRTRQEYHRHVAETIAEKFPQTAQTQPELVAQHYFDAGQPTRAADYWLGAGKQATAQGATLEARTFYDRVLEHIDPSDLERRWAALVGREHVFDLQTERDAQKKDIEALLELAEAFNDDTRRAQAFLYQMKYALRLNDYLLANRAADAAIAASHTKDLELQVQALGGRVHALTSLGEWEAAEQAAQEALVHLPKIVDALIQAYTLGEIAIHSQRIGDLSRTLLLLTEAAQAARRAGDRRWESRIDVVIGLTYIQLGCYSEARTTLEEGLELAQSIGERGLPITHMENLSYVYWSLGEQDRAIELVGRCLREYRDIDFSLYGQAGTLTDLGFYLESAGEWSAAASYLSEARALYARLGTNSNCIEPQAVEARCMLALGRQEEAQSLAREAWKYLREHGSRGIFFPARIYVGIVDVTSVIDIPGVTSGEVIDAGYRDVMQRAEKISDADWRRSFLENVSENREIMERWKKIHGP